MALTTRQLVVNLSYYHAQLPRIEPDGSSPCPDAEGAYFRAALAERALSERLRHSRECLRKDEERLRNAKDEQGRDSYRRATRTDREEIAWAERALRNAQKKRFPREPRGPWGESVAEAILPYDACPDHLLARLIEDN